MQFIDIGINLTNKSFQPDLEQVIADAKSLGVEQMIITGTCEKASQEALQLAIQYNLYCTAGVHPHDAKDVSTDYLTRLTELASKPQVVAIGECGLDFNRNYSPPEQQQRVFAEQLSLSKQLELPVFLHQRDAFQQQAGIIDELVITRAVTHCFTGDKTEMKAWLDRGFYIGITGWLCDPKRGSELRDAVQYLPLDRVMIETDGPYLLPKTLKAKSRRNVPANLPHIAEHLSQLMNCTLEQLASACYKNTQELFALND